MQQWDSSRGLLSNIWNTPYPETIYRAFIRLFNINNKQTIVHHGKMQGINEIQKYKELVRKKWVLVLLSFLIAGYLVLILSGERLPFFEIFTDYSMFSASNFLSGIDHYTTKRLGTQYINNLVAIYLYIGMITSSLTARLIQIKIFNDKEPRVFSVEFMIMTFALFSIAFFCNNISETVVRYVGINHVFPIQNYPAINVFGILSLNFLLYFCIKDAAESLIVAFIVPVVLVFLSNNHVLGSRSALGYIIIAYLTKIALELLKRADILEPILDKIRVWFYSPKYIIKIGFSIVFLVLMLFRNGGRKR